MDAETLNCQSCGAAVASDAPNCTHCGAMLATVSCASCFGMLFLGSRYCPHCGQTASREVGHSTEKECPACKGFLTVVNLDLVNLLQCLQCQGVWLNNTTFEEICRSSEQQATVLSTIPQAESPDNEEVVRCRRCPECAEFMARNNFARYSGVIVDTCRVHGTWFDLNELRRVVEYIQKGGYLRSIEKERRALESERRRLELMRDSNVTVDRHARHTNLRGGSVNLDDGFFSATVEVISQIKSAFP